MFPSWPPTFVASIFFPGDQTGTPVTYRSYTMFTDMDLSTRAIIAVVGLAAIYYDYYTGSRFVNFLAYGHRKHKK